MALCIQWAMTDIHTPQKRLPITPVNINIAGHTDKLQIRLDEDATDNEILIAVHDAGHQWSGNLKTSDEMRLGVGKVLLAVSERKLYRMEPWGDMRTFLEREIEKPFKIAWRTAYDAMKLAEAGFTNREVKHSRLTNLLEIAKVVTKAPEEQRAEIKREWTPLAKKSIKEFKTEFHADLNGTKMLRSGRGPKLVRLTINVRRNVSDTLTKMANAAGTSISEVVSNLVLGRMPMGSEVGHRREVRAS